MHHNTFQDPERLVRIARLPDVQRLYDEFVPDSIDNLLSIAIQSAQSLCPGFVVDRYNRYALEQVIRWLMADRQMTAIAPRDNRLIQADLCKGIFLWGPTGSGKSVLVRLVVSLAIDNDVALRLCGQPIGFRATKLYKASTLAEAYTRGDFATLERCRRAPILVIDDLGTEPTESLYMGNRLNVLSDIIEGRGDRAGLVTIITSNLPLYAPSGHLPSLHRVYGARVSSRLEKMCNVIPLYGQDRRSAVPPAPGTSQATPASVGATQATPTPGATHK